MTKIAIFASGAGSNARQIINFFSKPGSGVQVGIVISNNASAGVIEVAKAANIESLVLENEAYTNGYELNQLLSNQQVDLIILAGFLRKIPIELINSYNDRIINLHPSLLPKYGGKGMYGKYVHEAVILHKESESGITIHLVNEEYDKGKILLQKKCLVEENESPESLAKKIQVLEHKFFPLAISNYVQEIGLKNEN